LQGMLEPLLFKYCKNNWFLKKGIELSAPISKAVGGSSKTFAGEKKKSALL